STAVAEDRLVMAQTLWRHGSRTPTGSYPTDPYQESFWGVPWGELTTGGMQQHFEQGQRMRQRYMNETGLLSEKYSRYETTIRSADTPRCIESAMANMASFYAGFLSGKLWFIHLASDSPTFPSSANGWPSTWTPIPVHSMPHDEDRELEAGVSCPRESQLKSAREKLPVFQDFLASKWQLFTSINANAGGNFDVSMYTLSHMLGILRVERDDFHLPMPSWVSDKFYADLMQAVNEGEDFTDGEAGFGLPEDTELLRLRGGFMLKEWVKNINDTVNGATTTKYFGYSGHDTIERALLLTLGVKNDVVGPGNPDYASVIYCELWMRDGQYFVKMLYSPDSHSEMVDFSSQLHMKCLDGLCPLSEFLDYTKTYIPSGPERREKSDSVVSSNMKTILLLSAVLLAVLALPGSRPTGRPSRHRGKNFSPRPLTVEQKKKFEEELEKKVAKLSPEAQEAAKKIKAVFEEKKGDHKAVHKAIEEITSSVSASVKKELDSLKPKGRGHHGGARKAQTGASKAPRGSRGSRG
ncbi:hypothetical protein PFISCL1PPCAC_24107, partial [Pristionchus fissidentatus]